MEMGHPARTSCHWGETNWQPDWKVSHWEEVSQEKNFCWLGWLSLQIPEGCLVESWLNVSGPARQQGGEEMERTSPQRTDLALSAEPGCKIDGLTQGDCLMDRTGLVTPARRLWGSPLGEEDPHLDLSLLGQESLAREGEEFGDSKSACNQHICWGLWKILRLVYVPDPSEDALQVQGDCGEGEQYPPVLIFLPLLKGVVMGLREEGCLGQMGEDSSFCGHKLYLQSFSNVKINTRLVRNPGYRASSSSFWPSHQRSSKSKTRRQLCRCLVFF